MADEKQDTTQDVADAPLADASDVQSAAAPAPEEKRSPRAELESFFERKQKQAVEPEQAAQEPAAGKEPATPQAEKQVSANDELPDELPADRHAANEAWKRHRQALKEIQAKAKAQQAAEPAPATTLAPAVEPGAVIPKWITAQEQPPPPAKPIQPEPATPDKVPTPFLFEVLARQAAGEENIDAAVEAAKEQIQSRATPKELLEIMGNARRGGYGKLSEDVAAICREWLPIVQANMDERRQQQAIAQETGRRYEQSWQEANRVLPGLHDPNSQDAKEFVAASKTLSDTFGLNGQFFRALPNAPAIVANYLNLTRAAAAKQQSDTQLAALREENRQLKRRLGISESPQASRQAPASGQRKLSPREELQAGLRAAGLEV